MPTDRSLLRVALTGGIATGKSHCLRRIAAQGVPTIDSDVLAREAVRPGTPGLRAVVARFGNAIVDPGGELDRAALGRVVFADLKARRDLEAIVHPEVFRGIETWFARLQGEPLPPRLAVADVPLLFETGYQDRFDRVIVAFCEPDEALRRLMKRDGLSQDEARQRVATQLPIDLKRARADYVIDTSGTTADTDRQVDEVIARLRA
jgi:dephospho-CoA kinase